MAKQGGAGGLGLPVRGNIGYPPGHACWSGRSRGPRGCGLTGKSWWSTAIDRYLLFPFPLDVPGDGHWHFQAIPGAAAVAVGRQADPPSEPPPCTSSQPWQTWSASLSPSSRRRAGCPREGRAKHLFSVAAEFGIRSACQTTIATARSEFGREER